MTIKQRIEIPVKDSFENKQVLLTGSTGFLGKVMFLFLLKEVDSINNIYLIIRPKKGLSAFSRFKNEIVESSAFYNAFKHEAAESLNRLISKKVRIIEGDVSTPLFGLSQKQYDLLLSDVDLVINSAGVVDFNPPVDLCYKSNTLGALNLAEFTRDSKKASLAHISTCYVAPNKSGTYDERLLTPISIDGEIWCPNKEKQFLESKITSIHRSYLTDKEKKKSLIELGSERAKFWQLNNTYCYTKALAEFLIYQDYSDISYASIRPSVIESALSFPVSGWNEGLTTTAGISYLSGGWWPYWQAKDDVLLDIIPVDTVVKNIVLISAGLMSTKISGGSIFQLSTSFDNPFNVRQMAACIREWHRRASLRKNKSRLHHYFKTLKEISLVDESYFLSPRKLTSKLVFFETHIINRLPFKGLRKGILKKTEKLKKALAIKSKIDAAFRPFVFDNQYKFLSQSIKTLVAKEDKFNTDTMSVNWSSYWLDIHMPGMSTWVFPQFNLKRGQPVSLEPSIIKLQLTESLLKFA